MVCLRCEMDCREEECANQVKRYASIRAQLMEGSEGLMPFFKRQEGPFTLLPFSRKKLINLHETSGLPADGVINLSSLSLAPIVLCVGLTSDTIPFLRELLVTSARSFSVCF